MPLRLQLRTRRLARFEQRPDVGEPLAIARDIVIQGLLSQSVTQLIVLACLRDLTNIFMRLAERKRKKTTIAVGQRVAPQHCAQLRDAGISRREILDESENVLRFAEIGLHAKRFFVAGDRVFMTTGSTKCVAEITVSLCIFRIQLNRPSVTGNRIFDPAEITKRIAQFVVPPGIVGS